MKPELEIRVSLDQPIIVEDDTNKFNLLTISLESMHAIPESWNNSQKELAYTVSIPVPVNDDVTHFDFYFIHSYLNSFSNYNISERYCNCVF
jgi:hypothetical protein